MLFVTPPIPVDMQGVLAFDQARAAEVRHVDTNAGGSRGAAPVFDGRAWGGVRVAQSSAGPSTGIGTSAGPVSGSINPYTAAPGGMSTGSSSGGSAIPGMGGAGLGTQQEQSGSAGAAPSGAASRDSRRSNGGVSPTRPTGAPGADVEGPGPGPGGLDRGTSAYSNAGRGAGLMETGSSVTEPPPPSLTDSAKPTSAKGAPAKASSSGGTATSTGAGSTKPATPTAPEKPIPPPPAPVESGSTSTR